LYSLSTFVDIFSYKGHYFLVVINWQAVSTHCIHKLTGNPLFQLKDFYLCIR